MRDYSPEAYIKLVENTKNLMLNEFMDDEISFIHQTILNSNEKDFIDLGAGYGRTIPMLIKNVRKYFAVEINNKMYSELKKRENEFQSVTAIHGDILDIKYILSNKVKSKDLVFLLLQNTIGTIEGNRNKLIAELKSIFQENNNCELIISFFNSAQLPTLGIDMFSSLEEMVGKPDKLKSSLTDGIFISQTGYEAKWFNHDEINDMITSLGAKIASVLEKQAYSIFHLKN